MQINISNLSEGVHHYDLSEDVRKLELDDNFFGSVISNVTLEKSMDQLLLKVDASIKGVFVCDRCSEEFEKEIEASFTAVYAWENDEEIGEDDDFHLLRPDENIIDISKNVREYLMLAVPLKLECKRKECKIPKRHSSEETSIDPRWEKLKELIKQEPN